MERVVVPEILDTLAPSHELAIGSRSDIHRLNRLMGNAKILARAFRENLPAGRLRTQPLHVADLGAGEGLVMLDVARESPDVSAEIHLTLVDRHSVFTEQTRRELAECGWRAEMAVTEVLDWLELAPVVDVMFVNLLLHQFRERELKTLLQLAAGRTKLFIGCEPRRSSLAFVAARWVGLAGANAVTRHDAPASVQAGFLGKELSALWPTGLEWELKESEVGMFGHLFIAKQNG
jgi:hypothetical protein